MSGAPRCCTLAPFSSLKDKCRVSSRMSRAACSYQAPEPPVHPVWAFLSRLPGDRTLQYCLVLFKDIRSCRGKSLISEPRRQYLHSDQDSDYLKDSPGSAPHNWRNSSQHAEPHPGQNSQRPVPETWLAEGAAVGPASREGLHPDQWRPAT